MANVKFPVKEIEKHFTLDEATVEKINMFGTPVESVDKKELELEILPNRPDLLSLQGFLRSFKAFLGKETGIKKYKINKPEKDYKVIISPSVKDVRPYTACAIVKNLNLDDEKIKEIIDLQEKLHITLGRNRKKLAIGIYPLEKIKLPITFEARDPKEIVFQPLEYPKELNGYEILEKHPTGKEFSHLLKDKKKFPIFIDANNNILSMPPIINSHLTGKVTEQTKNVFIECSGFDLNSLKKTINILITVFADMGGEVYQMELNYGKTPDLTPQEMTISLKNVNKLLGLDLKEENLKILLPKMGYDYENNIVKVPAWRNDVIHEVDIIEDIAIAYGFDKLIPEIPKVATIGQESKQSKIKSKISETLVGLKLAEVSSYHLVKPEEANLMKLKDIIEVEDSKSEFKFLRPNLFISAMRILSENKSNEYPQNIFEIGTVFKLDKNKETGVKESENLIVALCPGNFTEIKQALNYLSKMLNVQFELKESTKQELIEGRAALVLNDNKKIGYMGEIAPETLIKWNVKMPVAVLEINISKFLK